MNAVANLANLADLNQERCLIEARRALAGMGLDEKALAAVRTRRFEPAKIDGRPVAVQMNVIVNFRLF